MVVTSVQPNFSLNADVTHAELRPGMSPPVSLHSLGRTCVRHQRLAAHAKQGRNKMMDFGYSGILGLLILVGDIWAIINIFQSSASNEKKLIWIVAVVLLPVLGLILWFFLGPRDRKA
jgi:hypothetical protein